MLAKVIHLNPKLLSLAHSAGESPEDTYQLSMKVLDMEISILESFGFQDGVYEDVEGRQKQVWKCIRGNPLYRY